MKNNANYTISDIKTLRPHFSDEIKELENKNMLMDAARRLYKEWKEFPNDVDRILSAGTAFYAYIMINDYDKGNAEVCGNDDELSICVNREAEYLRMLDDVTDAGMEFCEENALFSAYFGFMISMHPFYFKNYGEYDKKGRQMLNYAVETAPENPVCRLLYMFGCKDEADSIYETCNDLWTVVSPETWGDSIVQSEYFTLFRGKEYFHVC